MITTPKFWYSPGGFGRLLAIALTPASLLWRLAAGLKARMATPYHPSIPVVVVGNLTAGGTGKTPLVAALAKAMAASRPVILTRGHGGRITGPHLVTGDDTAADIGDEAKWLSGKTPVVVARHRGDGARWIETHLPDCQIVIMDDGLQNTTIAPHTRLAVFSGDLGAGNGKVIPAGPLREDFASGLGRVDGVIITGEDTSGLTSQLKAAGFTKPVMTASRALDADTLSALTRPVIAFAGIGHPQGFVNMLLAAGVEVVTAVHFPDHHPFSDDNIAALKREAAEHNALLVTTEKDLTRISGADRDGITAIPLTTRIDGRLMDIMPKRR
ncbi:MAG: tetraacyldisaccharide 4'-kinase [Alphaproteobacteria bacterium]|nr:tetraacyldisaccharide 4'-kinase [Alphaproteobacteria bacterium]